MQETLIRIAELHKDFVMGKNTVYALNGIDLSIDARTFTVIMGPSGSGKSTLLYLIGGLDRPTAGKIIFNGKSIDSMDENALATYRRKSIGFIFQSFNLIQSMTALENIEFPMRFAKVSRKERRRRAIELLQTVGLADRALHKPTELSGGQQQRVAIARALVNNPEMILADEPTGNLDTGSGASIMQVLSDLHQSGRTVFVVTHDQRMSQVATQTLYLIDGCFVSREAYLETVNVGTR
jgi:putative ABC transport system ATP-binding protein